MLSYTQLSSAAEYMASFVTSDAPSEREIEEAADLAMVAHEVPDAQRTDLVTLCMTEYAEDNG